MTDKTLAELVIERFVEDELQETARTFARTHTAEQAASRRGLTPPPDLINREFALFDEEETPELTGRSILTALHLSGWRVVRTQPLDPGHFIDARDDNVEIIEEWKP